MASNEENLSEKRYLTLLLRVLVDKSGTPVHGEVLDVLTKTHWRFGGWHELMRVMQDVASDPTNEVVLSYGTVTLPRGRPDGEELSPREILVRLTAPDG